VRGKISVMKVILLKNIDKLGRQGEIKEVSIGYARNFLIPRGLADQATPDLIAQLENRKKKEVKQAEKDLLKIEKLAEELDGKQFGISAKASDAGSLYAAITKEKIVKILSQEGYEVSKSVVSVDQIKTIGNHSILLAFPHGIEVTITLLVTSA